MTEPWFSQLGYLPFVLLSAVGVYLMLSHRNFLRALVGLQVLQTGVILFFVLMAVREGATIPILPKAEKQPAHAKQQNASPRDADRHAATGPGVHDSADVDAADAHGGQAHDADHADDMHDDVAHHSEYQLDAPIENPIPQALMLTAIVVGVATQGVGLAILRQIRNETGSIEDPQQVDAGQREGGRADV